LRLATKRRYLVNAPAIAIGLKNDAAPIGRKIGSPISGSIGGQLNEIISVQMPEIQVNSSC
jgi:hypothetical protein